ncbi:MAG: DsbA family protein [Patescibacteria group bacterium]|jgi:protein-disulfide isomerase
MFKLKSPLGILSIVCALSVLTVVSVLLLPEKKNSAENNLENSIKENNILPAEAENQEGKLSEISDKDHLWGDLNNPVKMVIYSDFECPFCGRLADTVKKVMENYQGKVVIAFRHRPLAMHSSALSAAMASECAAEQGKFWEMHDMLFQDAKDKNLSADQFKKDAKGLGLAEEQFNTCLDSDKYKEKVESQSAEGRAAGAEGTPTFFINNYIYPGAYPFEDYTGNDGKQNAGVKTIIDKLLQNS